MRIGSVGVIVEITIVFVMRGRVSRLTGRGPGARLVSGVGVILILAITREIRIDGRGCSNSSE